MSQAPCIRYLRDYVAIPSVNPMGRSDIPADVAGETRYAEHVCAQLRRLGVDADLIGRGDRCGVVATVTSPAARETFLMASHLDTVPVDTMEIDPFDPAIADGRLYGRGACDTKAGMAAFLEALERVLQRGRLRRNVVVVGEADEEYLSVGCSDLLDHLAADLPAWSLATEPTELRLATHHKGIAHARIGARGRACHASRPEEGHNAIVDLARVAIALDALAGELAERVDPRLGRATLNVGVIHGGQSANVVPDHAWLAVDRRLLPGEDVESARREFEAALARSGAARAEIEACYEAKPPLATGEDEAPVRACATALDRLGLPSDPTSVAFGTDAAVLARSGIPGVVMGPGSIAQAHTDREFVEIRQVEQMTEFFVKLLEGD